MEHEQMSDTSRIPEPVNGLPPRHEWAGDLLGLDHSVIRVPDLEEGTSWYRRLLGLVEAGRRPGTVYLASPLTGTIVLGLAEGGTGLAYTSFRARDGEALGRLAGKLGAAGTPFQRGVDGTRPGGIDALRIELPTGHTMELLHAEDSGRKKPGPGYPGKGYVAGAIDVRTSHLQVRTTDVVALSDFVQQIGFRVSNYVPTEDGTNHMIQFTRVNDYHHQFAILTGRDGLHHVALELDQVDFYKFLDHLAAEHIPAEYGPGRHVEGNLLFIYVRDPFGNRLEITGPMEHVGYDYPPHTVEYEHWFHMNMWGPQPPESWYKEWT